LVISVYSLPNSIQVIKSRRMTWVGHLVCIGEGRGAYRWGNLGEGDHLEDLGVDGTVILKWIFKKWDEEAWTG
jgi:hypothetical protein